MFVTKFCPAFNNIRPKIFRVVTNFFNDKKNYIILKFIYKIIIFPGQGFNLELPLDQWSRLVATKESEN